MEVRYSQDSEPGMLLKNGLKEGKEGKDSQANISKTFLKDQQESFSPSGPVENCEKSRTSSGDPDYCRRILVRGKFKKHSRGAFCTFCTPQKKIKKRKSP